MYPKRRLVSKAVRALRLLLTESEIEHVPEVGYILETLQGFAGVPRPVEDPGALVRSRVILRIEKACGRVV